MEKIVLFVDNDADFLNTRTEFLEEAGYRVEKAYSRPEAHQRLAELYVHLMIVDIRLEREEDDRDTSGLSLAKQPAYRSIPKIILTAYPEHYQYVRMALRSDMGGVAPAVDFLSKGEGAEVMVQTVDRVFERYVSLNPNLKIDYQDGHSALYFAQFLQPDLPHKQLLNRTDEFEDLLRRLFKEYCYIRFDNLLWRVDDRFCLSVLTRSHQNTMDRRILVCGKREPIQQEQARMKEFSPETARNTKLTQQAETVHYGALLYHLPGMATDPIQTWQDFFHNGNKRQLKGVLNYLLAELLPPWHQHGQKMERTTDLMTLYRQWSGLEEAREKLERQFDRLIRTSRFLGSVEIERTQAELILRFPAQTPLRCPDPVQSVYTPLEAYENNIVCKGSSGCLRADNILVDSHEQAWLTNFGQVGLVPHWWDFVCLEAIIRFQLSQSPDMIVWQQFEECLIVPTTLKGKLSPYEVISDLRLHIELIGLIRQKAAQETGETLAPYSAGLLIWLMATILQYDITEFTSQTEQERIVHLLLAAGLLAKQLKQKPPASQEQKGELRLTSDGRVFIGEALVVELGGREWQLLSYMYEHPDRIISREEIINLLYPEEGYNPTDSFHDNRINNLIRLIRRRIEPIPNRPRYLHTIRNQGYRLQIIPE